MDDKGFAQSRGDDDLFDDEIIPIEPSEIQTVTGKLQETSIIDNAPKGSSATTGREVRGGPRGRGTPRGAGRAGRGRGGSTDRTSAPASTQSTSETPSQPRAKDPATAAEAESQVEGEAATPETPSEAAKPQAVRGDRTATGGVKKPKLTEAELTAKMAEAKTRATALSEAHARAQADAASFEERERVAQAKRRADAANRKVMDTEREANRRRKMQAQGIREWDMEKNEEDFVTRGHGRGSGFMRGAHGGIRNDRRGEVEIQEEGNPEGFGDQSYSNGRGRGYRGRGSGRDHRGNNERGRGGNNGNTPSKGNGLNASKYAQPDTSADSEFPSLPPGTKTKDKLPPKSQPVSTTLPERPSQPDRKISDVLKTGGEDRGTWADQMESSTPK